jgi:hypothetical protein
MALQKQVLSVPFAKALDTKTDPKQVVIGKFLTLENGVFTSPGRIKKRNGYMQLNDEIEGTLAPITSGTALANFKNEVLLMTGTEAYSFSDSTTKWTDKQTVTNMQLFSTPVVRNTYQQTVPDVAIHSSGLEVITYEDSRGGSRYSLIDSVTGEQLLVDQLISSTAIKPKPFTLGNFLSILYIDTVSYHLIMFSIPVVAPLSPLTPVIVTTNINTMYPNYDAALMSSKVYVAYNSTSGIGVREITSALSPSFPENVLGESASSCIGVTADSSNGRIWVAYHNGTEVKYFVLDSTLPFTPILSPTNIVANSNTILNIVITALNGAGDVYFTQTVALSSNNFILTAHLTDTGTVSGNKVFIRSVSIAGKIFTFNSINYITTSFDTVLQPTYFILRTSDAAVIAKFSPGLGGGTPTKNIIPETPMSQTGIFLLSARQKDLLTTISGAVYTQTGLNLLTLDFANAKISKVELGGNLHLTGGILSMYDGISVVEHGFNIFPENITASISNTGGGIKAGTYEYFVVYTWMDAQGQTHYSAPSVGLQQIIPAASVPVTTTATFSSGSTTITVGSATGLFVGQVLTDTTIPGNFPADTAITAINGLTITLNQPTAGAGAGDTIQTLDISSVMLTIPTLRLTQKKAPIRGPVVIQVYRTLDSQTIGFMVSSILAPLLNDTTVDTVAFIDTQNDAAILGNPTLYTTGGVIENIAAPACTFITTYQDRIILLPSENQNQWWFSKQNIPGAPVEFTDSFVNSVDQFGGNLVSALKMDSELILFKETLPYYVTGVGPDATGNQNDFSAAIAITADVGCSDKDSPVLTPMGIMFKSLKGIYLLNRGLQVSYIGADVETFNSSNVVSSNLIEDTQQVRFCLDSGVALLYDYYVSNWSVFTNHSAVGSIIFQGQFTYLTAAGKVLQETLGVFSDNGEFIKLKLVTSWLSFVGLQAFQRVYQMLFLGDYFNPHNVAVFAAYDFNPFPTQQNITQAGAILGSGVYGSDATYGESSPYGGPPQTYQFRVNLNRQKCETIQITIEDNQLGASFGENLALSAFGFVVGTKGTLNKIVAQGSNTSMP